MTQTCNNSVEGESCCGELSQWLAPELFKALADANRLAILERLAQGGQQRVSEVASCCEVDLSVVSRHLKTLRDAGFVEAHKKGKEVLYRVQVDKVVSLLRGFADALERCCPSGRCYVKGKKDETER